MITLSLLGAMVAFAQNRAVEASVKSLSGSATLTNSMRTAALRRDDKLAAGDVIETATGCRLVLDLSDGSQMIVYELSRVVMKDFRFVTNLRELVEVMTGRVRIKISKLGGRPNPYRVNSPTASIAVRGTEFTVDVAANGETLVAVIEGLVEVASLIDPTQRRLVKPGRNVVVRASGDISHNQSGPGSELGALRKPLSDLKGLYYRDAEYAVTYAFNIYNRNTTERSFNNLPTRFAAFADSHFDSLLNPAFATEFERSAGRLTLLPSFSAPVESIRATTRPAVVLHPFDYAANSQSSYFTPLMARWVIGGALSTTRTQQESYSFRETRSPGVAQTDQFNGAATADTANVSLIAARRLGARERTSIGFKFDRLESRALLNTAEFLIQHFQPDETYVANRFNEGRARSHRTTVTVGLAHEFVRGDKLGVTFSYGTAAGGFRYHRTSDAWGWSNPVQAKQIAAVASETTMLWRGPLTRRWFYGVEASWITERVTDDYEYQRSQLTQRRAAQRPRIGGGLGFAWRPRTIFSFDLSSSRKATDEANVETTRDDTYRDQQRYGARFLNGHLGLQTDLGRRLFASASVLRVFERRTFELFAYHENYRTTFSHFSMGWRVKPNWLAQYFVSTDYGSRRPSHSLVLRYEFQQDRRVR